MMQKIINTLFYGSTKAKLFLWSLLGLILLTVLLAVFAAVLGSGVFGAGAAACGVAAFITSQSVSLQELERKEKKKKEKAEREAAEATGKLQKKMEESGDWNSLGARERSRIKSQYLASMTEKKLKREMKDHQVRQNHIFAMVDSYPEEQVYQTPAVVWRTDHHLHVLVLEGRAHEIQVPLDKIQGILYQKGVAADPEKDYPTFRYASFVSKMYAKYLPEYQEVSQDGEIGFVKNVFSVYPGIVFTNTSMAGVLRVLPKLPLLVDDPVNQSAHFDEYFKEIYRYSILCRNNIYTLDEYRKKMEETLNQLLQAPISSAEFSKTLRDLNRYHLITSEYVTKYTQLYCTKNQLK